MKSYNILLLTLSWYWGQAQQTEGLVTYSEDVKLQIDVPEEHREMLKNMPTTQHYEKILAFNANESIYKDLDETKSGDVDFSNNDNGNDIQIQIKKPINTVYMNLKAKEYLNATDLFGKFFLIKDNVSHAPWKITGEQKTIASYPCIKAEMKGENGIIYAWFTTAIPVSIGPNGQNGLPGLILCVESDNGNRITTATKIEFQKVDQSQLEKPSKGKVVTRDEFNKIRDEKLKEMGIENGGSGVKMIIREERR